MARFLGLPTNFQSITPKCSSSPAATRMHAAYGSSQQLQVFDIWESQESFQAFGQTLMPILQQLGIDPGQPAIKEVHNTIPG